ncbi:LuxR C-terminal-related transcriptional regulator [Azospirillum canadense]|uniref:LuxR C-terminal-related transcriptional regulator n=1 Tax=Azospirillum canadense TaxID=403962 RepID=UPI002227AE60|nr:response regulator transcription factor [Azospirillum canadense]MCW2243128.1 DNA-binding NarL/FixJ family response regulator [Azospirillum canadense]
MILHRDRRSMPEGLASGDLGSQASSEKKESATGIADGTGQGPVDARGSQDVTVLLLDDMPLTRECLSLSINICDRGVRVVTATSVSEAMQLLQGATKPDVALCNFGSLDSRGFSASRAQGMVETFGRTPVIVLSNREDGDAVQEAFQLGAHGYISSAVELSVALEAIRLVAAGGSFVPAGFLHRLMQNKDGASDRTKPDGDASLGVDDLGNHPPMDGLSPRQRSVLACMKEGKPNKIIAYELGMRESTVKVHVRSILKKIGAINRTEAVYRALRDTE